MNECGVYIWWYPSKLATFCGGAAINAIVQMKSIFFSISASSPFSLLVSLCRPEIRTENENRTSKHITTYSTTEICYSLFRWFVVHVHIHLIASRGSRWASILKRLHRHASLLRVQIFDISANLVDLG